MLLIGQDNVFRSAIKGDGGAVDAGYLALFWTMSVTVGMIPLVVLIAGLAILYGAAAGTTIQSAGIAIGAMCTGAAAVIGAVGLFRAGDKPHPGTTTEVVQSASSSKVTTPTEDAK